VNGVRAQNYIKPPKGKNMKSEQLKVIVGLGKTGLSCAKYFAKHEIPFAVTDTRNDPPALQEFKTLFPDITLSLGSLDEKLLLEASEIIISPGLSLHEPAIAKCAQKGISIIGDIELFVRVAKAPICAITGSNGKSTVTTLVGEMVKCAGKNVQVGGNLGVPALDLLAEYEPELYVLELSSFQLETTFSLAAQAATVLNISPDHMDRYPSVNEYAAAKHRIYHHAKYIIWNRDDSLTQPYDEKALLKEFSFGLDTPSKDQFGLIHSDSGFYLAFGEEPLISVHDITLKGSHNWSNALAALALGHAMNLPMPAMLKALQTFKGLAHRCQWVGEYHGINWYNDSKGTNVGASVAALKGLASSIPGKVILIAGGLGKGADFSELRVPVAECARAVILIGEDAPKIKAALADIDAIKINADSLQEAVRIAAENAKAGDAVLLSPACASFDMFNNFEHRGEVFMAAVKDL
jgi:UDP-N-acetylmuramoylalanine--D-glutamate ligase